MDESVSVPVSHGVVIDVLSPSTDLLLAQETFAAFLMNLSGKTALVYRREALTFLAFAKHSFDLPSLRELRRNHIIFYREYLERNDFSNKTILKKLSAISSFCKFLATEGIVEKDIVFGVRRPRTENKKETADLADKDVRRLFDGMKKDRVYYVHHRAILAVGFYTGLRSAEIRNLKLKSYAKVDGHNVLRCIIKGGKVHEIPLNPFVVRCLDEHVEKLKALGFELTPEHYLFPAIKTRQNKPIQAKSLWEIFRNRLRDAGIELSTIRRYSPHSMRATLAGHLLNTVEAPLEQVQQALGHASPTTTMKYNKRARNHDRSPIYRIEY